MSRQDQWGCDQWGWLVVVYLIAVASIVLQGGIVVGFLLCVMG